MTSCRKLGALSDLFVLSLFFFPLLFCTSCRSAKDKFVEELTAFTEQVCASDRDFSSEEWSIIVEQYQAFREEGASYRHEFTAADRMLVDSCYRDLNATIAKGYLRNGAERINSYLQEAVDLLEDLLQ